MTDEYRAPTAAELRDTLHALLPHRSFELAAVRGLVGDAALILRCPCGRFLRWPDGSNNAMPMNILLTWAADHDDDIFLTPDQLATKYEMTIRKGPTDAILPAFDAGRPLLHDPDRTMGERP